MESTLEPQTLTSFNDVLGHIRDYLPTFMAGLAVALIGFFVAWIAGKLLVRLLLFSRLDRVVVRMGWARALGRGDVRHSLFAFVGIVFGGIIFLIFLDNAIVIWRLTVLSSMLEKFVLMIPRMVAATIIFSIGWGIAAGVSRAVQRVLYQEEIERARLVGRIVHAAVLVVASAIALVQLNIAVSIVTGAFFIAFGALGLSFVLAFGLGSKSAVEYMWNDRLGRSQEESTKSESAPKESEHDPDHP